MEPPRQEIKRKRGHSRVPGRGVQCQREERQLKRGVGWHVSPRGWASWETHSPAGATEFTSKKLKTPSTWKMDKGHIWHEHESSAENDYHHAKFDNSLQTTSEKKTNFKVSARTIKILLQHPVKAASRNQSLNDTDHYQSSPPLFFSSSSSFFFF